MGMPALRGDKHRVSGSAVATKFPVVAVLYIDNNNQSEPVQTCEGVYARDSFILYPHSDDVDAVCPGFRGSR
jgi:hypothetical protein